ncbi:CU044_2847 family protein [Microbacterium sp. NPDC058062]|uniref:CU044_2847 family protein n=1 Tax=Microbacterium sp. NPDC058062 TaxID=3346320 RepID=UPI0036DE9B10
MGTNLVEFPLGDGGSVVIAAGGPNSGQDPSGPVLRGRVSEAVVTQASESFETVVQRVQPAATAVLDAIRSGPHPPSEVTIEFGIEMSADLGAVIASTAVQANFKVTITWQRDTSH